MTPELLNWESRFIAYLRTHHSPEDGSHDLYHFQRVWRTACKLSEKEPGADLLVMLAAAYFHDLIVLPKDHPDAASSSQRSADKTGAILEQEFSDFPREKIAAVQHAIHAHSFSANIDPLSPEARILQDADRMEAIGAIGIARVFYTAGLLRSSLFEPEDPLAMHRLPDDKRYALDHFQQKLLQLPQRMTTGTGRLMAEERAAYLPDFLERIGKEITE